MAALAAAVQREIWAVDPNQTIDNVRTLESSVEGQLADRNVQTGVVACVRGVRVT